MPRPRHLISDLTGGEISPRVLANSQLQRYPSALKYSRNWLGTLQGGMLMRRGTEFVGASAADGVSPLPAGDLINWTSSDPAEPDITFEIIGNTLTGFTTAGQITASGAVYAVTLPIQGFANYPIQSAQRGRKLVLTNGNDAPIVITVNGTASWTVAAITSATWPSRAFSDSRSPPKQNTVNDVTFQGFAAGNTYYVYVDGKRIMDSNVRTRSFGMIQMARVERSPRQVIYSSASTVTNEQRIKDAIAKSPSVDKPDDITVAFQAGTTYRITMGGESGGVEVSLVAAAESATVRIEQATNAAGRSGEELAWSYPTVVTQGGNWYQCLQAHVSTATLPGADPTKWALLPGAPAWEAIQPSTAWSATSVSYGPGGRGFPRACTFHEQRLVLGGSREAPRTLWASKISAETNFILGVEDDEAWTRDIDTKESPSISWLATQQGLVVGTTRGIFVIAAEVTLTPTEGAVVSQSSDRCEPVQPVVVVDEIVFVQLGRRQLRRMRWNKQSGPFESEEMSALAEHLTRYRVTRLQYAHAPQPVIYAVTENYGLLLAIPYSRATNLVAFFPCDVTGEIRAMTVRDGGDGTDELWLVVNREGYVAVERMPYPITTAPVDTPVTTATKHLDGWVKRTDTAGSVTGLRHLIGQNVTVLNSAGAVQETLVPVLSSGAPTPATPVVITQPGFEAAGGWTYTSASRTAGALRSGAFGADLSTAAAIYAGASILSANITITPGLRYKVSNWTKYGNINGSAWVFPLVVRVYNASAVQLAQYIISTQAAWPAAFAQNSVTFTAPATASYMTIGSDIVSNGANCRLYVDDVEVFSGTANADGVITATGTDLIVGVPFRAKAITVEPVVGNPAGPSTGNPKRWANIVARLFQSALPLLNGDRPSDYDQAGGAYRASPGALRSGDYKVNTEGWADGAITIEQDLPHQTQVLGLFGDLSVGVGG